MQADFKIIGVGSPIVDAIAQVNDSFLEMIDGDKGGMVLVDATTIEQLIRQLPSDPIQAPGGSAGNTAFALAHLGTQSALLGKTGNCEMGAFYRNAFQTIGGDSSRFKIGDTANGQCLSLVTPDSERTLRTNLGAAMTLAPEEISSADFAGCHHAHIEGYLLFNEALMMRVLDAAKEAGCSISLDLASFEVVNATKAVLPNLLRDYVDIVFANEEEADAFTGLGDDYAAMAKALSEYCDIAAVKIGAKGSYLAQGATVLKAEPVLADNVIDTTAAGDFWAAGFLYGWSRRLELLDCARIGSILGAAVVQEQGSLLPDQVWDQIRQQV
ncbi:adenosine kinase [Coraliomargarita akajimensis]|uniref:PfkB domain protein n=1 Tax=Coraliomargarita akajimensis (strain DSM 45221 / IAM 15411 / JCM 23193 / KCTC 12865 / 04OKA010-24) TaxID=583355 RepID=D5EHT9_CORAD|nr:adenosine kinase [Coraliomargarita akajimensis]ADE54130.1 PfkB domain protein [Coraliomargarita akajimensis DSM 45221]